MCDKKIFTSYFGCRQLDREKHFLVRISNGCPRAVRMDGVLEEAIPDWKSIVVPYKDSRLSEDEYRARYVRILDGRKEAIRKGLVSLTREAGGRDVVLLCFEAPDHFCHRHIFAEWAAKELELEVSELSCNDDV